MILAESALKKEIANGSIKITPLKKDQITEGSIDMTLAGEFRIFTKPLKEIKISEKTDCKKFTKKIRAKSIKINPGEMILGITKEKICLPEDICGWIQGRSKFARVGLSIHVTSSFIQPGSENRQVFEIYNAGPNPLAIHEGDRIAQLILQRCEGKGKLKGKFKNQSL